MKTIRLCAALLTVAPLFALAGTAGASTPSKETVLVLTVAMQEGEVRSVGLKCEPNGGTHPSSRAACGELIAAKGNFNSLSADREPIACTMEYRPVTALAHGLWRGKTVTWRQVFSNPCTLRADTGQVFQF